MWGRKEKKHEHSGFVGDMSEEQTEQLEIFKKILASDQIGQSPMYDDYYLLRFLRARKFDLDKTKLMFVNFLKWREEKEVDTTLKTYILPREDQVLSLYQHNYHKTDMQGRPVYIDRPGLLKFHEFWEITDEDIMEKHYIQSYEKLIMLRFPACSEVAGKKIEQGFNIVDLTGGSMKVLNKRVYGVIQIASKIGQDYYPEIMGQMYIVNAPMLFSGVWSIIKGFLDEKTRNKIKIIGGGFKQELLQVIEADNLPDFLGGNCTCADKGGCMYSDIGPWSDYETVEPIGIKRKGA